MCLLDLFSYSIEATRILPPGSVLVPIVHKLTEMKMYLTKHLIIFNPISKFSVEIGTDDANQNIGYKSHDG